MVKEYGGDKAIFERVLFAFGLLQSLVDVNLDFVFKGGTCLLLFLDNPRRFSTDIDIMVNADTDIDEFITEAGKLFPFESCVEHHRRRNNGIEKRHFKFEYTSIISNTPSNIILDVVFEDDDFIDTKLVEIKNSLHITEDPPSYVKVPIVDYMIADKLSAFAPNTIGVLYNSGKDLEIIKQMHDVAVLFDHIEDFEVVKRAYYEYSKIQIKYRRLDIDFQDCLNDTIEACISILSDGAHYDKSQFYKELKGGIKKIGTHIFGSYSRIKAIPHVSKVLYIASMIRHDLDLSYIDTIDVEELIPHGTIYANLNRVKKIDSEAFKYIKASVSLL
ncbi:nucleotidyl transferase AbiEii/AbiGii toxin family protein [Erysipelothrix larvae]|nr:nucleotidyl transferase AbiEii/AbiGii toxin family protein [Erysipelothrix larvae]